MERPPPPVPADADLQDFPFMPLHVARLRDSDLAAEQDPEACWYAVLLWAAAWHQLPAGSLPDNDNVLMRLVGLGRDARTWKKHRSGALHGFVQCSDGRLYHEVVAEQVNAAWDGKLRQRHRTYCAAVRKHNERHPKQTIDIPSFEDWESDGRPHRIAIRVTPVSHGQDDLSHATDLDVACETPSKRERQGQGQGQGDSYIGEPKGSLVPAAVAGGDDIPPESDDAEGGADKPLTPSEIAQSWNRLAYECGLPLVERLSPDRLSKVKARLKAYPELRHWQSAFATIRNSPFLRGQNDREWRADFDFLIQAKSFNRLVEGSYTNGK